MYEKYQSYTLNNMINEIYYKIFRNTAFWDPAKGETVQKYINKDRFSNIDYRAVENIENHFEFKNKQVLDLGPGSWKLGSIYNSNFKSGEEIRLILNRILESTGQSAGYWVKAGSKKVCLYRVNSKSELNHYVVEGTTFELKSATGKVIKAFTQNDQELKNLINKKGYIYTAGERLDNIASVAVPIFNNKENFTGTLSISGWRQFFTNKSVAKFYKILSGYQNQMKRLVSNE